ncbi:MAG TPA: toxin-antitoxin (TA) system antitoxin [Phycisphaerae bacterium]|nr:toxin-antitoxin (TA) system antitoxin [Phycisphaerae bacterium]
MPRTVTIKELQERAPELLAALTEADEIIIADSGAPRARIRAVSNSGPANSPKYGFWAGQMIDSDDFDQVLPDSFWLGEE